MSTARFNDVVKRLALPRAPITQRTFTRWLVVPLYAVFGMLVYLALFGTVVLNATDSLHANGFFALKYPKPMIRGAVVVVPPPDRFADKFEGLVFAKRLIGRPGDVITRKGSSVCIAGDCFAQGHKNGAPFGTLLAEGAIPKGFIAPMGETANSLDSRYAEVGLFQIKDVIAVGFAIPHFPHWSKLKVAEVRP